MPALPRSLRWLTVAVAAPVAGGWLLIVAVTALAWAWRATEPPWLLPTALLAELLVGAAGALWWRRWAAPLAGTLHRSRAARGAAGAAALGLMWVAWPDAAEQRPPSPSRRVAVVGAGAAGVHATWMLHHLGADVTLYEATHYVGGHAYTHPFSTAGGEIYPVDLGFVFGAPYSYQEMKTLMAVYGVERVPSALALSGEVDGHQWATGMDNLHPEAVRFQRLAEQAFDDSRLDLVPFWSWLTWNGFDRDFRDRYLGPLLSVLFITDVGVYQYSTRFVLNMLAGPRRWLDFESDAPAWVVGGGSSLYYERLASRLSGLIRRSCPVTSVRRLSGGGVELAALGLGGRITEVYDDVVLAVPADVARRLVVDRSWLESLVLSQVRYDEVEVLLHGDPSRFPDPPLLRSYHYFVDHDVHGAQFELSALAARASGNGRVLDPEPVVTLNPLRTYADERLRLSWRHHTQDLWHLATALELLPHLQGRGGLWYAGDWVTFIGHGPAMSTGINAACHIAGTTSAGHGTTGPCVDVDLVDASPLAGLAGETATVCGEEGAVALLAQLACDDVGDASTLAAR